MIAQYGVIAIGVYGSINVSGFALAYAACSSGVIDTASLVQFLAQKTPVEQWSGMQLSQLNPLYANAGLAYACNLLLEPVRLGGTMVLTPRVARWWREKRASATATTTTSPDERRKKD